MISGAAGSVGDDRHGGARSPARSRARRAASADAMYGTWPAYVPASSRTVALAVIADRGHRRSVGSTGHRHATTDRGMRHPTRRGRGRAPTPLEDHDVDHGHLLRPRDPMTELTVPLPLRSPRSLPSLVGRQRPLSPAPSSAGWLVAVGIWLAGRRRWRMPLGRPAGSTGQEAFSLLGARASHAPYTQSDWTTSRSRTSTRPPSSRRSRRWPSCPGSPFIGVWTALLLVRASAS